MAQLHISINKSDVEELSNVSGIGPERAVVLDEYRKRYGGIRSWAHLESLPGFTKAIVEELIAGGAALDGGYEAEKKSVGYRAEYTTRGGKGGFGGDDLEEE